MAIVPRYRGLLIGNASFPRDPHALPTLRGPRVDIEILGRALTDDKVGLFSPGDVMLLPDRKVQELREHLDKFFTTGERADVLLLYYSGHGRLDEHGRLYLCTGDTKHDRLRSTALSAAEINNMIDGSAAPTTIIVLDCCHSGAWKAGTHLATSVAGKGRYVLASNRSTQLARDAEAEGQPSPFTGMLVHGLRHAETTVDLTVSELYRQVHHWMTEATPQHPQLSRFAGEGDVVIARRGRPAAEQRAPQRPVPAPPGAGDAEGGQDQPRRRWPLVTGAAALVGAVALTFVTLLPDRGRRPSTTAGATSSSDATRSPSRVAGQDDGSSSPSPSSSSPSPPTSGTTRLTAHSSRPSSTRDGLITISVLSVNGNGIPGVVYSVITPWASCQVKGGDIGEDVLVRGPSDTWARLVITDFPDSNHTDATSADFDIPMNFQITHGQGTAPRAKQKCH